MTTIGADFLIRFGINAASLLFLIWYCYYRRAPNRDFLFSFSLFGMGVFIVSYLLHAVQISMGFAFGLFAIFSMLRYRTEPITIKAMTYLFLVITIALLSAVGPVSPLELMLLNGLICGVTRLAESRLMTPRLAEQIIRYEKIDNIHPQNRRQLLQDLGQRTGLEICSVVVEKIDFLRDTARLRVFYVSPKQDRYGGLATTPPEPVIGEEA